VVNQFRSIIYIKTRRKKLVNNMLTSQRTKLLWTSLRFISIVHFDDKKIIKAFSDGKRLNKCYAKNPYFFTFEAFPHLDLTR
jgi:hypothetical protein